MGNEKASVAVLGLGHGGSRVAAGVYEAFPHDGFHITVADTDQRALGSLGLPNSIVLGADWARGQGCGGDVKRGERAAAGCRKELTEAFGSDLTVVVVGLGGGAGSGAAAVVARLAREAGMPVVFLVTLPIALEGRARRLQAEESLRELRETVETVVAVDSDNLFATLSPDTPAPMAFATANRVLAETVAIWGRLFLSQPLIPVDLAAMRSLLGAGAMQCHIGIATGEEGKPPEELVEELKDSPFLGGKENLLEADSALIGIVGNPTLTMGLLTDLMNHLDRCFATSARLVKGGGILPDAPEGSPQVQIIVVACRQLKQREGPRQLDLFEDNPVVSHGRRASVGRNGGKGGSTGIVEPSLGVFAGSDPTKVGQENLDVPTFQRKGIPLDLSVDE
jgi:cell division protein FtsZ